MENAVGVKKRHLQVDGLSVRNYDAIDHDATVKAVDCLVEGIDCSVPALCMQVYNLQFTVLGIYILVGLEAPATKLSLEEQ